jgi:PadR family transcriptional regulator PadR
VRADVSKGHLDLLLLAALEHEPAHGYAIVQRLRDESGGVFELAEGTIYPALYRLERAGLLRSSWAPAGGRRRRRVYSLTRRGRAQLAAGRRDWSTFARALETVLGS